MRAVISPHRLGLSFRFLTLLSVMWTYLAYPQRFRDKVLLGAMSVLKGPAILMAELALLDV